MTLIGSLIHGMRSLIGCVWRHRSRSSQTKSSSGRWTLNEKGVISSPSLYVAWPSAYEMRQMEKTLHRASAQIVEDSWLSDTVHAQRVTRNGMSSVFIGGVGTDTAVFYSLRELAEWFVEHGIDPDDPVWMYLEHLASNGD